MLEMLLNVQKDAKHCKMLNFASIKCPKKSPLSFFFFAKFLKFPLNYKKLLNEIQNTF